jgi:hypothetical protein
MPVDTVVLNVLIIESRQYFGGLGQSGSPASKSSQYCLAVYQFQVALIQCTVRYQVIVRRRSVPNGPQNTESPPAQGEREGNGGILRTSVRKALLVLHCTELGTCATPQSSCNLCTR